MVIQKDFPELKNDLILRVALSNEKQERVPVWIMRQAGRYLPEFRKVRAQHDFFTICRTPELACEVTLQPIDRYDGLLDASIIFSDILVVPQALGLEVQMLESVGPHFPNPIRTLEDLSRIKKEVDVHKELGYVFDAISLTRRKLDGRVPLFGFVGAPWTLFAYMIEGGGSKTLSKAKSWLFSHPKESHWLLQRVTDVVVDFLVGQAKAGAQLLQVFDSWGGELNQSQFHKFSLPYLTQIASRVKMQLNALSLVVPLFVFAKGVHHSLDSLSSIGYNVVSLDWTLDPKLVADQTKNRVALQGNADPALLYAPKDVIRKEVAKMITRFETGVNGHIANLGHGMHPDHDPEHLRVYLEAIRDFSTKK